MVYYDIAYLKDSMALFPNRETVTERQSVGTPNQEIFPI